jgi:Outer membrane protein beta-barrel domain
MLMMCNLVCLNCKRIITVKRGVGMRIQQMITGMMLLLSFGVSQADEARHFMGFSAVNYSDNDDVTANRYQYGYDFSNLLSLEVNYDDTDLPSALATEIKINTLASVMLRFNRRYESINTYFMLGASHRAVTDLATSEKEAITGTSYGVGIELYGSKNTAITFSWSKSEYKKDGVTTELDATTIGLVHHFDFAKPSGRY